MLISFETIIKKYNMNINVIFHIGVHNCEELDSYNKYGLKIIRLFGLRQILN